jgi:hypothetical protein
MTVCCLDWIVPIQSGQNVEVDEIYVLRSCASSWSLFTRLHRDAQLTKRKTTTICRTEIRSVVSFLKHANKRFYHPTVVKQIFVISFVHACDAASLCSDQTVLLQLVKFYLLLNKGRQLLDRLIAVGIVTCFVSTDWIYVVDRRYRQLR